MKIYVSHSTHFDFMNELYAHLRSSHLGTKHNIILPHEGNTIVNSEKVIKGCDLVIAEVSIASTGTGIELGWAVSNDIPIICFYKKGTDISKSLGFVTKRMVEYSTPEEMVSGIEKALKGLKLAKRDVF